MNSYSISALLQNAVDMNSWLKAIAHGVRDGVNKQFINNGDYTNFHFDLPYALTSLDGFVTQTGNKWCWTNLYDSSAQNVRPDIFQGYPTIGCGFVSLLPLNIGVSGVKPPESFTTQFRRYRVYGDMTSNFGWIYFGICENQQTNFATPFAGLETVFYKL